jgi:GNAT superfamily N-acetyltransferase
LTRKIEKLQRDHAVEAFDCGNKDLNRFLQQYALLNQNNGASITYVGLADQAIIGYYSLAVGSIEYEKAPERVIKGLAHHSIPIMLLARLAVDYQWQKKGIGAALLKDAMLRTLQAADIAGIRAFVVHAKDDVAKGFYERFDFLPSPSDPLHLFILLKDVRKIAS